MSEAEPIQEPIDESKPKRIYKYSSDEERHNAIKRQKLDYYYRNKEIQKLKSLKSYYTKQLMKTDLKEDIKNKYQNKLDEINEQLINH